MRIYIASAIRDMVHSTDTAVATNAPREWERENPTVRGRSGVDLERGRSRTSFVPFRRARPQDRRPLGKPVRGRLPSGVSPNSAGQKKTPGTHSAVAPVAAPKPSGDRRTTAARPFTRSHVFRRRRRSSPPARPLPDCLCTIIVHFSWSAGPAHESSAVCRPRTPHRAGVIDIGDGPRPRD